MSHAPQMGQNRGVTGQRRATAEFRLTKMGLVRLQSGVYDDRSLGGLSNANWHSTP